MERLSLDFTSKILFCGYYLCVLRSFYGVLQFSAISLSAKFLLASVVNDAAMLSVIFHLHGRKFRQI